MIRLDKYLADMGIGTRSEVKRLINKGLVCVDSAVIRQPETKIDADRQAVTCQGRPVTYVSFEYYMLNKPAGVVSASSDKKERTVVDLIDQRRRKDLFPVGRLDKDTEGLLLITNDGDLAHRLLSPKKHVDKVYFARISGVVDAADIERFAAGVDIQEEKLTMPARLSIESVNEKDNISEITLTICEGKFHQVKRMFQAVGKEVMYLKRLSMGSLILDEQLKPGEYRPLTEQEIKKLC